MNKKLSLLFSPLVPSKWREGANTHKLATHIENYFGSKTFLANSGRSCIYIFLKSIGIEPGDEVILQAYTCNAVPNPILWAGAKPVYVDIDPDTLNADVEEIAKKINSKTRCIIVQHTFGRPAEIEKIVELAKKWGIYVLEDCAHSLGAKYKGKKLGTFGDGAILSFGREKVISSLTGGALLINNKALVEPVASSFSRLGSFPISQSAKEILNFISWRAGLRKIYFSKSGYKVIKRLYQYDFFNVVTAKKELAGNQPDWHPSVFPDILASVALDEWSKIEKSNKTRAEIAEYYYNHLTNKAFKLLPEHDGVWLRLVALHPDAEEVLAEAKRRKFWFGNWYDSVIYPQDADLEKLSYESGSCPKAEKAARESLNLPNFVGMSFQEAEKVVEFINSYK